MAGRSWLIAIVAILWLHGGQCFQSAFVNLAKFHHERPRTNHFPQRCRSGLTQYVARHSSAGVRSTRMVEPAAYSAQQAAPEEDVVVDAIRDGVAAVASATGFAKATSAIKSLGTFGFASGALVQVWLTPQRLEDCASFWGEGSKCFVKDVSRGRVRSLADVGGVLWLGFIAVNSFPFTPLLLPLIDRALLEKAPKWPTAFSERRRAAFRRFNNADDAADLNSNSNDALTASTPLFVSPQNLAESATFLRDGARLALRDVAKGRLFRSEIDRPMAYVRFALLSFTTFPLTPLLLPLIDKWRGDRAGVLRGDYVPAVFRVKKMSALRRLEGGLGGGGGGGDDDFATSVQILRAASRARKRRPPTSRLLSAILTVQKQGQCEDAKRALFFSELTGSGIPGKRWKLIYTADKDAVVTARRTSSDTRGTTSGGRVVSKLKALLPWSCGVYVDSFLTAIQRFDDATFENENGVFALLGFEQLRFSVTGPFKWPDPARRTVCAFRPTVATVELFGWKNEFPLDQGPMSFEDTPATKLPFFKFVLVDEKVAVAIGRSGGAALWARIQG